MVWAANMAVSTETGFPWIMCKDNETPYHLDVGYWCSLMGRRHQFNGYRDRETDCEKGEGDAKFAAFPHMATLGMGCWAKWNVEVRV